MERLFKLGRLLDYYGDFLTGRQRDLLDAYVNENLSLAEIAEREGISRQGVRDGLVRAERQLTEMEARLGIAERNLRMDAQLEEIRRMSEAFSLTEEQRKRFNEALQKAFSILEDDDGV